MKNINLTLPLSQGEKNTLPRCRILTPYPELDRMIAALLAGYVTVTDEEADILITDMRDGTVAVESTEKNYIRLIPRPIVPEELLLAVSEVPERGEADDGTADSAVSLDREKCLVFFEDMRVKLSPTEMKLFQVLLAADGYLDAETLAEAVWGVRDPGLTRVYMTYLRKKLSPLTGLVVHGVRGEGYRLMYNNSVNGTSVPRKDKA